MIMILVKILHEIISRYYIVRDCTKIIFDLDIVINVGHVFLLIIDIGITRVLLVNFVMEMSGWMIERLVCVYVGRQDEMINDRRVMMVLMMLLIENIPYVHASIYFSFFILLKHLFTIYIYFFLFLLFILCQHFLFILYLSLFVFMQNFIIAFYIILFIIQKILQIISFTW